jgi:predicted metalloprotease with PDZ domain
LGAGVGGETRFAFVRLPGLELGPLSAPDVIAGLSLSGSLNGDYYDALLGARLLQRFRVTFDYSRREIILEPDARAQPAPLDRSGAYVIQDLRDAHRFTIHSVAPGSPAAQAGLLPGDVVAALDGRPAAQFTLTEIRTALAAEGRPAVAMAVVRAGRTIETTIRLRALL